MVSSLSRTGQFSFDVEALRPRSWKERLKQVPVGQGAFPNGMASGTKRGHAETGERD